MAIEQLVKQAFTAPLSERVIRDAATDLGTPVDALLVLFAKDVAEKYLAGAYSWDFGDVVMNNLYSCAYAHSDLCLPEFARRVFEAFDEGEYIHLGESADRDGEPRTRALLTDLLRHAFP
ncbi:MAG: hypothetical protein ACTHK7_15670 [Aureliella sp.]